MKNELTKAQAKHKLQYEKEKKMYQKMMRGTSEEKQEKKVKTENTKSSGLSSFATYTAAGLLMAGATLGVACPAYEDSAAAVDDSAAAVDDSAAAVERLRCCC